MGKISVYSAVLLSFFMFLQGCAETTTPGGNNDNTGDPTQKTGDDTTTIPDIIGGTVYYTGYDGGLTDFSIFINTGRTITVHDPSIATVTKVDISIDETTVQNQLDQLEQVYIQNGETVSSRRKGFWERRLRNPSFWKVTPLKAGITTIAAESRRGQESVWEKGEVRTIVISEYTPQQIQQGQQRYEGLNGGIACTSCHKDKFSSLPGAPPHLLGRVSEISDKDAAQWINSGRVKDRVANQTLYGTTHAWTFNSDAEKFATVAYLRSRQTANEQW